MTLICRTGSLTESQPAGYCRCVGPTDAHSGTRGRQMSGRPASCLDVSPVTRMLVNTSPDIRRRGAIVFTFCSPNLARSGQSSRLLAGWRSGLPPSGDAARLRGSSGRRFSTTLTAKNHVHMVSSASLHLCGRFWTGATASSARERRAGRGLSAAGRAQGLNGLRSGARPR